MRTLCADMFCTVDGLAAGRESAAYFGYSGPDLDAWVAEQVAHPQVMLMGATTYRAMATIVGSADDPGSARMNDLPKVVFSRTLEPPLTWSNTTLVSLDLASAVPAMKAEDGDPLRLIGSLSVLRSLLRLGLVDRLRLLLFPQLLGATGDESVFENLGVDVDLRLESTRVLDGRLVLLEYQPLPAVSAH